MKKKSIVFKVAALLIAVAPALISPTSALMFIGEPELPAKLNK